MPEAVYLSLGSNLGDRMENLRNAVRALGVNRHLEVTRTSKVYETEPVGVEGNHPEYLNCVVELSCSMEPMELLRYCQGIEAALGRDRKGEMAPRTIDIDVLLYGDREINEPDLEIPHRGIERGFNLKCLADINAELVIPGSVKSGKLLAVADLSGVRAYGESLR